MPWPGECTNLQTKAKCKAVTQGKEDKTTRRSLAYYLKAKSRAWEHFPPETTRWLKESRIPGVEAAEVHKSALSGR